MINYHAEHSQKLPVSHILYMVVAIPAVLLASLGIQLAAGDTGDKCWLLLAARKLCEGSRLYQDIFETNPPLILWIYTLPAYIALHLPIKDYQCLVLLGFSVALGSSYACWRVCNYNRQVFPNDYIKVQFLLLLLFIFCFYTSSDFFADRESLFVMLAFPYLLRWMPSMPEKISLSLSLQIAVMAAIGFCIKPHCIVIFIAVQLLAAAQRPCVTILYSLENRIIYCAALLYMAVVCFAVPQYPLIVLPMLLKTYSFFKTNPYILLLWSVLLFAIPFADFRIRDTSPYRSSILYFLGLWASCLAYILLNNGWNYTLLPLNVMTLVLTWLLYRQYRWLSYEYPADGKAVSRFIFGARACLLSFAVNAAGVIVVIGVVFYSFGGKSEVKNDLGKIIHDNNAHSFGTMTLDFVLWAPLAKHKNLQWKTRFNCLWMLPKLIISNEDFKRKNQWIRDYVTHALEEDISQNKPDLMLVDASPEFYTTGQHVDLVSYFSVDAAFKKAWQSYRLLNTMDLCTSSIRSKCRYEVFRRMLNE